MKIRAMQSDDIPVLAAIVAANYDQHCAEAFHHEAACMFYNYPFKPRFLVATLDNEVVGCACWVTAGCSWGVYNICWVQVEPLSQRMGIGKALVNEVLAELKPIASLILLATTKVSYYEKHWGFKPIKEYKTAYLYEEDAANEVIMSLVP